MSCSNWVLCLSSSGRQGSDMPLIWRHFSRNFSRTWSLRNCLTIPISSVRFIKIAKISFKIITRKPPRGGLQMKMLATEVVWKIYKSNQLSSSRFNPHNSKTMYQAFNNLFCWSDSFEESLEGDTLVIKLEILLSFYSEAEFHRFLTTQSL
jgi:hypothetical protein